MKSVSLDESESRPASSLMTSGDLPSWRNARTVRITAQIHVDYDKAREAIPVPPLVRPIHTVVELSYACSLMSKYRMKLPQSAGFNRMPPRWRPGSELERRQTA
jgi:hypothetical protein